MHCLQCIVSVGREVDQPFPWEQVQVTPVRHGTHEMLPSQVRLPQHGENSAVGVKGGKDKVEGVRGVAVLAIGYEELVNKVAAILMPHVLLVVHVEDEGLTKLHRVGQAVVSCLQMHRGKSGHQQTHTVVLKVT